MAPEPDLSSIPVTSVMSGSIVAVSSEIGVLAAMDVVLGTGLRHLVVVRPDGRCEGIVTSEAIATAAMAHAIATHDTLRSVAPRNQVQVSVRATVREAAQRMLERLVDAVCVVEDDGRVVGVVTWSDIVGAVARSEPQVRARAHVGA